MHPVHILCPAPVDLTGCYLVVLRLDPMVVCGRVALGFEKAILAVCYYKTEHSSGGEGSFVFHLHVFSIWSTVPGVPFGYPSRFP